MYTRATVLAAIAGVSLALAEPPVPVVLAPGGLDVTATTADSISLSWVDFADNEAGFKLERRGGANGTWSLITELSSNVLAYTDTGLLSATRYAYRMRAFNHVAHSGYTRTAAAVTYALDDAVRLYHRYSWPGAARDSAENVTIFGDYAYVSVGNGGLLILDISEASDPRLVGAYDTSDSVSDVFVRGDYAFLADSGNGLVVLDVSVPSSPVWISATNTTGDAISVFLQGDYAYVATAQALDVIDVSELSAPRIRSTCAFINGANDVFVAGQHAYIAADSDGLAVVDISAPDNCQIEGTWAVSDSAEAVRVDGDLAYVCDYRDGLAIVDVSVPTNCQLLGRCPTADRAVDVALQDGYAFVAERSAGVEIIDIRDPENCLTVSTSAVSYRATGVAVSGRHMYVADYRGLGLQLVDVSTPSAPVQRGRYDTAGEAEDVALQGGFAYVADRGSGVRVLDLSDPAGATEVAQIDELGVVVSVAAAGERLYAASVDNGLYVYSITDPVSPRRLGAYTNTLGLVQVEVVGMIAYVAVSDSGLLILDVTDPAHIVELDSVATAGGLPTVNGVTVAGDMAYMSQEFGVHPIDISVPSSAVASTNIYDYSLVSVFDVAVQDGYAFVGADEFSDLGLQIFRTNNLHHQAVIGQFDVFGDCWSIELLASNAYLAAGFDGVQVVDVSDPTSPVSAGSHPTYGEAWDVDVNEHFVYVADADHGLMVMDRLEDTPPVQAAAGVRPGGVDIRWHALPGVSDFNIWRGTNANPADAAQIADSVTGTAFADTNAAQGQAYQYWVQAVPAAGGPGGMGNADTGFLLPVADLVLGAPPLNGEIDSGGEVEWYRFDVSIANIFFIETLAGTLVDTYMTLCGPDDWTTKIREADDGGVDFASAIVETLQPGTYYVSVRGYSPSEIGTYGIRLSSGPTPPTLLAGRFLTESTLLLSWQDNSLDEQGFQLESRVGGAGPWARLAVLGEGVTNYTDTALVKSTSYSYRVRALNEAGYSLYSATLDVVAPAIPAAPTGVQSVWSGFGKRRVTWNDVAVDEDSYEVERKRGIYGHWELVHQLPANSVICTNTLPFEGSYFYRVRAVNVAGKSPFAYQPGVNNPPEVCVATNRITLSSVSEMAALDASCSLDPDGTNAHAQLFFSWREHASNPVLGLLPANSDSQARVPVYLPRPGFYSFDVRVSDGLDASILVETITVYAPGIEGHVELDTAQGFVRVPDVRISAHQTITEANANTNPVDIAITDSLGQFRLSAVSPDGTNSRAWYVRLARPSFETKVKEIIVRAPEDVRAGLVPTPRIFYLSRGLREHPLEILLTDTNGTAITNGTVAVLGVANDALRGDTDVHGVVSFRNIPYGSSSLQIEAPGYLSEVREINVSPELGLLRVVLQPYAGSLADLQVSVYQEGTARPLAGAGVALGTGESGTTSSAGVAHFSDLARGVYTLTITAPDHMALRLPHVGLQGGSNVVNAVLSATRERTISGTVSDQFSDRPVRLATVEVEDIQSGIVVASDVTDYTGTYQLPGIPPGNVAVQVSAPWYTTQTLQVGGGEDATLDVSLPRAANWTSPRPVDTNAPIARVVAREVRLQNLVSPVVLSASNSVGENLEYIWRESPQNPLVNLIPPGSENMPTLTLYSITRPGIYTFEVAVQSGQLVSANQETITVYAPGLSGNVHVSPTDGIVGVDYATVRAYANRTAAAAWSSGDIAGTTDSLSDPAGDFALGGLSTGVVWLAARAHESKGFNPYGPVRVPVNFSSAAADVAVNLSTPEARFEGVVLAPDGSPLENVRVALSLGSQSETFRTSTDRNGIFRISDIPSGEDRLVMFSRAGYRSVVRLAQIFENQPQFNATLDAASAKRNRPYKGLAKQILTATSDSISVSGRVRVDYKNVKLPVSHAEVVIGAGFARAFTDANGDYRIDNIPPGTYFGAVRKRGHVTTSLVQGGGYVTWSNAVTDSVDVELPFSRIPPGIRGTVVDVDGPVDGVQVALAGDVPSFKAGKRVVYAATNIVETTDATGLFQFNGIPEGQHSVNVKFPDGTVRTHTLHVFGRGETLISRVENSRIPYTWRDLHFPDTTNAVPFSEDGDPDSDGFNNWLEYIANTDPTNGASVFAVGASGSGAGIALAVEDSAPGRVYDVWCKTNLLEGDWTPLNSHTNTTGGELLLPLTNAVPGQSMFYRAGVRLP